MKAQKTSKGYYCLLETGEEVVSTLEQFVKANDIRMSSFTMMGAVSHAELGYYTLSEKQYHWKTFDGEFEILGATGNVTNFQEEPVIHLHTTLSGADFIAFGGHVRRAIVAATCEIVMTTEEGTLERTFDDRVGLNLWKL